MTERSNAPVKLCQNCKVELANKRTKFCSRKCYDKHRRSSATYKNYLERTREHRNEYSREYYDKHPLKYRATRKKYNSSGKCKAYLLNYYYKNKEKILVRKYSRDKHEKAELCQNCGEKQSLEIHHLSYEPNITITLCRKCHLNEHKKRSHLL
jgi:hypothetical protein